jgi:O-methyltransferase
MMSALQKLVKSYYRRRGYEIVLRKYRIFEGTLPHSLVFPRATYSPWVSDTGFQQVYQRAKSSTLVDIYRCYELWQLVGEVKHLEGDLMEVGVWKGGTGALMASIASRIDPSATVFLCDTFEGVAKAGIKDNRYVGGEHDDTSRESVNSLLEGELGLSNFEILQGVFPDETGNLVADRTFKLCHVDVDVYEGAKAVTEWIWDRMPTGGIIVYDDFGFSGTQGVTAFLEGERAREDRVVVHNLNGHGLLIKLR